MFVPWGRVEARQAHLPLYLLNMLDHRDYLFRAANDTHGVNEWVKFNEFSKKVHKALQKFNSNVEKKVLESGSSSKFYRYLTRRLSDNRLINCIVKDGRMAIADDDKAELLADKFCEVFLEDNYELPNYNPGVCEPMDTFPWFDGKMIYEIIHTCTDSSSLTPDCIPTSFFKNTAHVIAGPLAYLFNQSLMCSEIPQRWKHSYVTPLLKKNPSSDVSNYRPVSITSFPCRIFEKVIKSHLLQFLSRNNVIPDAQHGFMPCKSVETNLLECLNDWTAYLDSKKACDVIYLDFSKAFDRMSHEKLLYKLEKLRIHPVICNWIREFLSNRTFQVKVGSAFSTVRHVKSGVPQGGVLSPLLFSIYTADIADKLEDLGVVIKQFADDVKIYREVSNLSDCGLLQQGVDRMREWSVT